MCRYPLFLLFRDRTTVSVLLDWLSTFYQTFFVCLSVCRFEFLRLKLYIFFADYYMQLAYYINNKYQLSMLLLLSSYMLTLVVCQTPFDVDATEFTSQVSRMLSS